MLSSFLCSIGGICYRLNTMSGNVQQALGLEMDAIASLRYRRYIIDRRCGKCHRSFFGVLINGTISILVKTERQISQIVVQHCGGCAALFLHRMIQSIFCKDQREEQIKTRLSRGCPLHAAAFLLFYGKIPCCVKKSTPGQEVQPAGEKGGRNMNIFQKRTVGKKWNRGGLLASQLLFTTGCGEWEQRETADSWIQATMQQDGRSH